VADSPTSVECARAGYSPALDCLCA
jgi:hypothetical protein